MSWKMYTEVHCGIDHRMVPLKASVAPGAQFFVRMEAQRQLPVGFLKILVTGVLRHTQNLIEILAFFYPAKGGKWKVYS